MKITLAIVSMLLGTGATLVGLVFCMAGGANSSEAQIRAIKAIMLGFGLCWVASLAVGIWALATGRPGWAAGIGILPLVVVVTLFIVAVVLEW